MHMHVGVWVCKFVIENVGKNDFLFGFHVRVRSCQMPGCQFPMSLALLLTSFSFFYFCVMPTTAGIPAVALASVDAVCKRNICGKCEVMVCVEVFVSF